MSIDSRDTWTELLEIGPDLQRKFEHHPLRLYFGTDGARRPILLLITDRRPDVVRLGEAVNVEVRERTAQREWSLILTLDDPSMADTFMDLCIDVAARSAAGHDESEALAIFRTVLDEFRDLLTFRRHRALSLEALRGLIAEIWFAVRVVAPASSPLEAIVAWGGPLGAPQDFRLPTGSLAEVKAIHAEARAIRISSPEQLDPVEAIPLELVTIGLEETAHEAPRTVSRPVLVDEFRAVLAPDSYALDELDRRLKALGILESFRTLETTFEVTTRNHYEVRDDFPRIRRSAVAQGIEHLRYEIKIKALREFEIDDPAVPGEV
jgi:hypothetical protein